MKKITIGRNTDNDIVILDQSVSGYHADLEISDNGEMKFIDHSTNGTMVNGNHLHKDFCYVFGTDDIVFPGQHKFDWTKVEVPVVQPESAPAAVQQPAPAPIPVQQPVYQQPEPAPAPAPMQQPVYQQPAPAPVPVQQPVYQQPAPAPVQQPIYQQPYQQQMPPQQQYFQIGDISFVGVLVNFWKNYFNFSGRARRKEYWLMAVWNMIFAVIPFLGWLVLLAECIGSISLCVRRLHDSGKSGWFLLFLLLPFVGSIVLLVFFCHDSERGQNKWGASSKYINA